MKKSDLAAQLKKKADLVSIRQADRIVSYVLECIENAIENGEIVTLRGFGTFRRGKGKRVNYIPALGLKRRLT